MNFSTFFQVKPFCRYPIYGGMQDWNYIHGGCFELTLEISDNKWPNVNEVRLLIEFSLSVWSLLLLWMGSLVYMSEERRRKEGEEAVQRKIKDLRYTMGEC